MTRKQILEYCIQKDIKEGFDEYDIRLMYAQKSFDYVIELYAHYSKLEHLKKTGEILNFDTHTIEISKAETMEDLFDEIGDGRFALSR